MSGFCYPPIPGTVLSPALCTGLLPRSHSTAETSKQASEDWFYFIFVLCHDTTFGQQHRYVLFSPTFLLSHLFSTSSNVISHVYFPCASSFLIPFLPLHTHILFHLTWFLLSFPHMLPAEKLLLLT